MFARTLGLAILLAFSLHAGAQQVSPEVRYKKAAPQVNEAFKRRLLTLHAAKASEKELVNLFGKVVFCGPNLYRILKSQIPDAAQAGKPFKVMVPIKGHEPQQLEGRFYKTPEDVVDFGTTVEGLLSAPIKLRPPTHSEIEYYWAIISFDIEEPLFVAESSHWALLVNGSSDGKIFYVELLPRQTQK